MRTVGPGFRRGDKKVVIPANAGIQQQTLGPGFRRGDDGSVLPANAIIQTTTM